MINRMHYKVDDDKFLAFTFVRKLVTDSVTQNKPQLLNKNNLSDQKVSEKETVTCRISENTQRV